MDTSLLSVVDKNEDKARRFQILVNKTKRFVANIDVLTARSLQKWDPQFREKVDNYEQDLQKESEKRAIVIVGDTSAGKSSILNLLFGEDIFPTSHLHTTSTICRIYAGKEEKIIPWTHDNERLPSVPLKNVPQLKEWMKTNITPKRKSSGASHRRTKVKQECPYKYVDIYLQDSILKDPLFLVDTPGTGKDDTISQQVLNYIENAAGLICVVNVANAGGIRERGLRDILKRIEENASRTLLGFDPQNAIFVFNKMDTVPEEELKDVRSVLLEEIKEIWPVVPKENILFFSVLNGSKEDLDVLFGMINKMVSRSLSTRWLCDLLEKCYKGPYSTVYIQDAEQEVENVKEKLKEVDILVDEFEKELSVNVNQIRSAIAEEYQQRIHSYDVRNRLQDFHGIAAIDRSTNESWESWQKRQRHKTKTNVEKHVNEILVSELSDIVRKRLEKASIDDLLQKKKRISECIKDLEYLKELSENMEKNSESWMQAMMIGAFSSVAAQRFLRPAAGLLVGAAVTKGLWFVSAGLVLGTAVYALGQNEKEKRESEMPLSELVNIWIEQAVSSVTKNDTKAKALRPVQEYILARVVDEESTDIAISKFNREILERWWIQYSMQDLSLELSMSEYGKTTSAKIANFKKLYEKMTDEQKKELLRCTNAKTREQARKLFEEIRYFE